MNHAQKALGQLVMAGGDDVVDLEVTGQRLDALALLVESTAVFALYPATRVAADHGFDVPPRQMKGGQLPEHIGRPAKLTDEPIPQAANVALMNPFIPPAAETWVQIVILSMP